jgi:hypothetical protein
LIQDPKTLEERRKVAQEFASQFKVSVPILVDTIDDQVEKAYAGWPDRIYVIDRDGKIAYKGGPGPAGFVVADVPPVLDRLLSATTAKAIPLAPTAPANTPAPDIPQLAVQRLRIMLNRVGVEEKAQEQVVQILSRKMEAFRALTETRTALMRSQDDEEAGRALTAYQEAQKRYQQTIERTDQDLDALLGYGKKPILKARLTAMGLLGSTPAPPLGAATGPRARP